MKIQDGWLCNIADEGKVLARRSEFTKVNWNSGRGPCFFKLPAYLAQLEHITVLMLRWRPLTVLLVMYVPCGVVRSSAWLCELPDWIGNLTQLTELDLWCASCRAAPSP